MLETKRRQERKLESKLREFAEEIGIDRLRAACAETFNEEIPEDLTELTRLFIERDPNPEKLMREMAYEYIRGLAAKRLEELAMAGKVVPVEELDGKVVYIPVERATPEQKAAGDRLIAKRLGITK